MHPLDNPNPTERSDWERWRGSMDSRLDSLDATLAEIRRTMVSGFEEVKTLVAESRHSGKLDISGVRNDLTDLQKDHERLKGRVNYLLPLATGGGIALGIVVDLVLRRWMGQ